MSISQSLAALKNRFEASGRMPVVFLGHGNPMAVIEDNPYSPVWAALGRALPRPQAILAVSAHWMTRGGTLVDVSARPRTIHDFHGFPPELYAQDYPAPGAPEIARDVVALLADDQTRGDESWGLDHGAWAVLKSLYPAADIPVFQLSIDMTKDLDHHFEIGRALSDLRRRGILILGSGNIVHNLHLMRPDIPPYDWAEEFDALFTERLQARDFKTITDRQKLGRLLTLAHPTLDHYFPALTIAGASDDTDELLFITETIDLAAIAMRGFIYS